VAGTGVKRFGISLFGFKKGDVNAYLERVIREFDQRLKEKDEENSRLKAELNEIKEKYDRLFQEADSLIRDKEKIAGALIQAHEKAEAIIQEARDKALTEKMKLNQQLESERVKIVDIKEEIRKLRGHIIDILSKYEKQMDEIITDIENREKLYINKEDESETQNPDEFDKSPGYELENSSEQQDLAG